MIAGLDITLDTPRIEFVDRLTPRQAVVLHYMWGLASDLLNGDTLMLDGRLRWADAYLREMRSTPDGQRQLNLMTARISGLAEQFTTSERQELGIVVAADVTAEVKCIRCGCTDRRACRGGCSWTSKDPPICSRCA